MGVEVAAWHEAGHALAAHLCGGVVRELTLESEFEGLEGHVAVAWPVADRVEDARRQVLVALAGPIAELVHRGEALQDDASVLQAWRQDWQRTAEHLARLSCEPAERIALRDQMVTRLFATFEDPLGYERLARIAEALDAHGLLDADACAEALGPLGPEHLRLL
ncbi:MAG: hypothetical protein O2816_11795 [Planctomycetota bacterium]|nr:hypothetical protein [Planctomycetota bacterium]